MLLGTHDKVIAIQWGIVIGASLVAAVFDVRQRRIPNVLTIPLLLVGLIKSIIFAGLLGLGESVGACILLSLPFVLLFIFAGGGAGDAKLMGAIGAWIGFEQGVKVLFCVVVAGIILALVKAMAKKRLKLALANIYASVYVFMCLASSHKTRQYVANQDGNVGPKDMTIPYGVAIFTGVCVAGGLVLLW
ncbi:MAG: A24 family peptidase [Planctomycetota bacterium]